MIKHFVGMFSLIFNVLCCFAVPVSYRVIDVGPTFDGWEWYNIYDEFELNESNDAWAMYNSDLFYVLGGGLVTLGEFTGNQWGADYEGDFWTGGRLYRQGDTNNWIELVPCSLGDGAISGRVFSDGAAVSGAVVRAFIDRGGYCEPVGVGGAVLSDSDGSYSFDGLETGNYWVYFICGESAGTFFERPFTGGVIRVEGAVTGIDLSVVRNCSLSGRLCGLWNTFGTNCYVSAWRRSVDKTFTDPVYPPGYVPDSSGLYPPGEGYIPPRLIDDGAWWWSVTGADVPVTDQSGYFILQGLEAGWYTVRFDGGNLSAPLEKEYYVDGHDNVGPLQVSILGVTIDNPPAGVFMLTKFKPELTLSLPKYTYSFVTGSTNHLYRLMTSSDCKTWSVLGSIIRGTDSGKDKVVGVSADVAAMPKRFFKLVRFIP